MCLAFAINAFLGRPKESLLGVGVAGLGIPLYFFSERRTRRGQASSPC
ncbi:MAG TPA: hypothetical protein P5079_01165 [Elusimicrobiota bacterium]|nr:hypothetical protein [Elusimicrobiota bacterium]